MSLVAAQQAVVAEFEALADWEDRYQRLIELGSRLERLPAGLKDEKHLIKGCQSQVWLHAALEQGRLRLRADSDALIVRGLVALLLRVYDGREPAEILGADDEWLTRIGMQRHLSPTRANGLASMLKQIRLFALVLQRTGGGGA
jgi:cysteine desulfuration protein SufE